MNIFHRFQNFRQFSSLLNFVFATSIEKATHVTLFWNFSRNPDKISSKIRRKNAKSDEKHEKNQQFNIQSREKCWRFLAEILRLKNGAKECIV